MRLVVGFLFEDHENQGISQEPRLIDEILLGERLEDGKTIGACKEMKFINSFILDLFSENSIFKVFFGGDLQLEEATKSDNFFTKKSVNTSKI